MQYKRTKKTPRSNLTHHTHIPSHIYLHARSTLFVLSTALLYQVKIMPAISTEIHVLNDNDFSDPNDVRYEVNENGVLVQISRSATGGQHLKFIYDVPGLQTANLNLHRQQFPINGRPAHQAASTTINRQVTASPHRVSIPETPNMPPNFNADNVPAAPRRNPPIQRGPSIANGITPMNFNAPGSASSVCSDSTTCTHLSTPTGTFRAPVLPKPWVEIPIRQPRVEAPRDVTPAQSLGSLDYVSVTSGSQRAPSLAPTEIITDQESVYDYPGTEPIERVPSRPSRQGSILWNPVGQWASSTNRLQDQDQDQQHQQPVQVSNILFSVSRKIQAYEKHLDRLAETNAQPYFGSQAAGPSVISARQANPPMFVEGCSRGGALTPVREESYKENVDPLEEVPDSCPQTPKAVKKELVVPPTIMTRSRAKALRINV